MHRYGIAVVCILFLLLGFAALNPMLIYTPDSARYLAWANSLASFDGFIDKTTPEPTKYVVHAPLYSVLLVPSQWLVRNSIVTAKAMTLLSGVLLLYLFYGWTLTRAKKGIALAATLVLALNPLTFIYSTQILSDVPFAACLVLFFVLADRIIPADGADPWLEWGFVGTIAAAIFLREVGLTIMLGTSAFFFWRKNHRRALTILLVCALLYLLWYVRNEVLVAGVENPPLRNTKLFFTHLYTDNQASIVEELLARIRTNTTVYVGIVGRIVLFPEFVQRAHSLVSLDDPLIGFMIVVLRFARYPMMLLMVILLVYGVVSEYRKSSSFLLFVLFLLFYFGPILLYPVNDIRFLYPLVLIILFLCACGWTELVESRPALQSGGVRRGAIAVLVVCLLPNSTWMFSAVKNNAMYTLSPRAFFDRIEYEEVYPEQFGKPLSLAAEWAAERCDSIHFVASRWKEVAFSLNGRPAVEIDPQTSMDTELRDYNVRYIVSVVSRVGIDEFEAAMARSKSFQFRTVHREGTVEVVEVTRKGPMLVPPLPDVGLSARKDSIRREFRKGLEMLEAGVVVEAESLFQRLISKFGKQADMVFHTGVAKEFAGNLDAADEVFKSFRLLPQAGTYVTQSWYHQEIISRIWAAENVKSPAEKASRLNTVAINYWELAYRHRALSMLRRSLECDSTFFPSLILTSLYSFYEGDRVSAGKYLEKSKKIDPTNVLVQNLGLMIQYSDSLRRARTPTEVSALRVAMANASIAMGAREEAISFLLEILEHDPFDEHALRTLADLYEFKRRFAPALAMVERVLSLHPNDVTMLKKRSELLSRW
ncbi:MAG: hypothetical protein WBD36_10805 [Bacteroidota bacterium]